MPNDRPDSLSRWLCGAAAGVALAIIVGGMMEGSNGGPLTASLMGISGLMFGFITAYSDAIWQELLEVWEIVSLGFWDRD